MSDGETLQEIKIRRVQNADIRKLNREAYSQLCDMGVKMAVSPALIPRPLMALTWLEFFQVLHRHTPFCRLRQAWLPT